MAVTDQQKLDFLLKKIGYTKTKTGSVVGTGAISGTPKQPFAEAIPSPLVVPNSSLWNEAGSIPATPPGSDTPQVKVYLAATSGLRMTADATSSGQRAYIAYSTYGNTSSTRLTNWIDTQFGASYIIKVYKGDPNSGGVNLSAAGSGANDGWFFDYSAGVLNFNDTSVPSGVTDTNIYIVGYRYIGQTGAPTSGISTFSYLDLTVERNLDVGGISTFTGTAGFGTHITLDDYAEIRLGEKVAGGNRVGDFVIRHDPSLYGGTFNVIQSTNGNIQIENRDTAGPTRFLYLKSDGVQLRSYTGNEAFLTGTVNSDVKIYYNNSERLATTDTGINVTGDGVFSGNVSIGGTLTYEDVVNVDSVGIVTARSGIRVTGGVIEAQAGENKIPSLYSNMGALPSAGSYHGMFAHVHATGRGYFAHAGNWLELVNKETNGVVGTGTEHYNVGIITASSFSGDGDFFDIDVDGHTELDNVNITGFTTFATGTRFFHHTPRIEMQGSNTATLSFVNATTGTTAGTDGMLMGFSSNSKAGFINVNEGSHGFILKTGGSGVGNERINISGVGTVSLRNGTSDEMVTARPNGAVELYHNGIKRLETSSVGVSIPQDLDVDGHTNLDNVSVAGITTFSGIIDAVNTPASIRVAQDIQHKGDADTKITFTDNQIDLQTGGTSRLYANNFALYVKSGFPLAFLASSGASPNIKSGGTNNQDLLLTAGTGNPTRIHIKSDGNIGIGTDNPSEILHIANSGNPKILIEDTDSDNQVGIRFKTTNYNWIAGVHGGIDSFKISHSTAFGSNDFFVINGAGNVSIIKDLDVDGHTNLDNVSVTGVSTFASQVRVAGQLQLDSSLKAGGSTGNNGEYLQSTGSGLTWSSFPSLRTRQTFTASSGQTTFSFAYTIGFLDVYVNGIKLTDAEFTATNGTTTVLAVGCFVGDIVELVAYNTVSASGGAFGIGNLVEDLSPQLGGNLDLNNKLIIGTGGVNITGVITATSFSGTVPSSSLSGALPALDGSALTGITASGSGVIIKHDGNTVGTAGTINFSTNLDVSPISAGIVTITASGGGGGGGGVSGINTIGGVVNIANDLDVDGHTNLDNVSIAGVTTASSNINHLDNVSAVFGTNGNATISHSGNNFQIIETTDNLNIINQGDNRDVSIKTDNGSGGFTNYFVADGSSGAAILYYYGNEKIRTTNTGINVTGNVVSDGLVVDGNSDLNGDLDVDGHTNLDNVSIAGVTTFTGAINVSDIRSDSITLKNAAGGSSYATFTNSDGKAVLNWNNTKRLETDVNGVNIVGILSATILAGDGSGITNLPVGGHYVQDEGNVLSAAPATVVNYVGAGVSATQSGSVATVTIPGATGNMAFTKIAVAGQSDVDADSSTDTLTLVGGSNMTITTNASNDTITFQAAGGGGGSGVDVGITTNLTGSFTAAGSAATINTYAYSSIDRVFEYTVLIEQGTSFQTSKVLAKRSGTTINAVQYAVMHNSNLLAQLDVIISSGEVRLMATPEPGVTGTTGYRIKREVM